MIAQELNQVFPEHIQILDELAVKEENIKLKQFFQVDKQGLVMDLIGAFQAHTKRFETKKEYNSETRSIAMKTFDATDDKDSGSAAVRTGNSKNGNSGNIRIDTVSNNKKPE